jgi:hypothetical protein
MCNMIEMGPLWELQYTLVPLERHREALRQSTLVAWLVTEEE